MPTNAQRIEVLEQRVEELERRADGLLFFSYGLILTVHELRDPTKVPPAMRDRFDAMSTKLSALGGEAFDPIEAMKLLHELDELIGEIRASG